MNKFLFAVLMAVSFGVAAEGEVVSGSASGAIANTASGATSGSSLTTNSVVDAADLDESVPNVFAAGVTAGGSNPCIVSVGGGISVSGFGINGARAYNDIECQIRESLRLMAAISTSAEPANQVFLREIACQSAIYWDSMERTALELDDNRYLCGNPRPETGATPIRDRLAAPRPTPTDSEVTYQLDSNTWYNENFGG